MTKHPHNAAPLIVDLGLHTGQDTAFYLKKGFRVLAVEADPELVERAEVRFAREIEEGSLELIHAAVSDHDGETNFHISTRDPLYNSIIPDRVAAPDHAPRTITVPSIAPTTVLERARGCRYLKIDIEGADDLVLQALIERPDLRPPYVSAEVNGPEQGALLYAAGYRGFQLINQARFARWAQPDPPREGARADHDFELHSSGLFGRELPDRWVPFKEWVKQWTAAAKLTALNPDIFETWFDVHARLDHAND